MSPGDASLLDNWVPDVNSVKPRKGYSQFTTGVGSGDVDTLTSFITSQGVNKFIAAGGGAIYDITTGTASSLGSGYSLKPWDTVSFNNHLIFVNGADTPQDYNGSTVGNASFTGSISPDRFFAAHVFKNRVLYAATDELAFWYTELFASTGIVTKFPLAGIAERGGSVVSIQSWTVDGGSGPDDFVAIFTSEGEVLVYQGTDPGSDFAIVGRYYIGPIVDNKAITSIFGKLFVVTERDYVYLPDEFIVQGNTKDSKLSGAAQEALKLHRGKKGWQAIYSANEGLLIVNVPTSNSASFQHVINVKTGQPCRFSNLNAKTWAEFGGNLYWGGVDGTVNRYEGLSDNGTAITCTAQQAPSLLRSNREKQIKAYRNKITASGDVTVTTGLAYDFGKVEFKQSHTIQTTGGSVLPQDFPFDWAEAEDLTRTEWFKGAGRGTHVELFLQINVLNTDVSWYGNDYIYESGGILR
jgi:hypothetical protein